MVGEQSAQSPVQASGGLPPGLAPFFAPPGLMQSGLIPEQNAFQNDNAGAAAGAEPDGQGKAADWGPEGYPFRAVDDAEVEPDNAILLWRRPAEPPPLAREAKLALAAAMRKAGLNPGEFAVSYWESLGESPWGRQVIPELTIVLPNGRKIDVCARWTRDTPEITLEDIRRAMGPPSGAGPVLS